jgi:AcrR family transcriptional regulator
MVRNVKARSKSVLRPAGGTRRGRRRDEQRDAILRAAARLFRERGVTDTGMREIAGAADLSAANLYYYFRGKDEILFYCQDRALDSMLASIAHARRVGGPVAERLHTVLVTHTRTLLGEVDGASAHVLVDALPPPMREKIVKKRDRYERALRRLVDEGVTSGEFVTMPAPIVTRAILGALNLTVTWFRPDGAMTADQVGDVMARYLVRGIVSRSPATRRALRMVTPT